MVSCWECSAGLEGLAGWLLAQRAEMKIRCWLGGRLHGPAHRLSDLLWARLRCDTLACPPLPPSTSTLKPCARCRFAEEFHKLALGLGGRYRQRSVPLQCGKGGGAVDLQQQAQQRR